jgi:hypothetical protein
VTSIAHLLIHDSNIATFNCGNSIRPYWSFNCVRRTSIDCLDAPCFKCLKFKYFQISKKFSTGTEKVVRYKKKQKTGLIWVNEIFSEKLLRKKPKRREKTVAANRLAQEKTYFMTTIYNQCRHKLSKRKNRDQFCPTFMPGKYSQASTVAPSICKWHQTG